MCPPDTGPHLQDFPSAQLLCSFRLPHVSPRPWCRLLTGLPAPVWPSSLSPVCSLGAQVCKRPSSAQKLSVAPHCPKEGVHREGQYFHDPSHLSFHPRDVHHTHVQHTPGPLHRQQRASPESPLPVCQALCEPHADHTPGAVLSALTLKTAPRERLHQLCPGHRWENRGPDGRGTIQKWPKDPITAHTVISLAWASELPISHPHPPPHPCHNHASPD